MSTEFSDQNNNTESYSVHIKKQDWGTRNLALEFVLYLAGSVVSIGLLDKILFPFNMIIFLTLQQIYFQKRGRKAFIAMFLTSVAIGAVMIALTWFMLSDAVTTMGIKNDTVNLLPLLYFIPRAMYGAVGLLLAGFMFINLYENPRFKTIDRLFIASALSSVSGIVILLFLYKDPAVVSSFSAFMDVVSKAFQTVVKKDFPIIPKESIVSFYWGVAFMYFSIVNFIVLSISRWIGKRFGARYFQVNTKIPDISNFRIADNYVWPVIVLLGCIAYTLLFDNILFGIVSFYLLLVFLSGFCFQGMGIIKHLVKNNSALSRLSGYFPLIVIVLFFTMPILLPFFFLIIAGLGISEIWIKYRAMGSKLERGV